MFISFVYINIYAYFDGQHSPRFTKEEDYQLYCEEEDSNYHFHCEEENFN